MAWENRRRGNRRYYYRSRRVDGRVVKEYVGRGPAAELAAEQDADARAKRDAQRTAERGHRHQHEAAVNRLAGFAEWCDMLVAGALLVAGLHNHRGEWRRRRSK